MVDPVAEGIGKLITLLAERWSALDRGAKLKWAASGVLIPILLLVAAIVAAGVWPGLALGDVLAIDTLGATLAGVLLAAVAGAIAVLAYAAATPQPRVVADFVVVPDQLNGPVTLRARPSASAEHAHFGLVVAHVTLHNNTPYAARNPAVRVTFNGFSGGGEGSGWARLSDGPVAVQWDGGADYLVHGQWRRPLPLLQVSLQSWKGAGPYSVDVEVVADGCAPSAVTYPIYFSGDIDWLPPPPSN